MSSNKRTKLVRVGGRMGVPVTALRYILLQIDYGEIDEEQAIYQLRQLVGDEVRACANCGTQFISNGAKKFCKVACKSDWHQNQKRFIPEPRPRRPDPKDEDSDGDEQESLASPS